MDPVVAHAQCRLLAQEILDADEGTEKRDKAWLEQQQIRIVEMAEAWQALDGWLSRGGFPPRAWSHEADEWAQP